MGLIRQIPFVLAVAVLCLWPTWGFTQSAELVEAYNSFRELYTQGRYKEAEPLAALPPGSYPRNNIGGLKRIFENYRSPHPRGVNGGYSGLGGRGLKTIASLAFNHPHTQDG